MVLKECFTDEFIESKAGKNIHKKRTYEKVVHAFYLLEKISREKIDFIFKGGTSLMLLLNEFNRFSVDVDILMCKGSEKICDIINTYTDDVFVKVEEDIRAPRDIIKRHFKFFYKSIYEETKYNVSYVLLDIVFDEFKYNNLQHKPIESHFVKTSDPWLKVKIPSIDEMLGDKLTAFAPNTIGILYRKPNQFYSKHVEIIKQLYDISKLYDNMSNLKVVKDTYYYVADIQLRNRGLSFSIEECLNDTISTCKLILTNGEIGGTLDDYAVLKKGFTGFENYVVYKLKFQDFLIMAAKVYILCIGILYKDELEEEANPTDTFVGRHNKYIRQTIGYELYSKLMKNCSIENKHIKATIN